MVSWDNGEPLCVEPARSSAGCIGEIHGEIAALPGGVLGTRGDPQSVLLANDEAQIVDRWCTRLARNHLMRLAYDAASRRVFALGSCFYTGGLARIDLHGGRQWRRGISTDGRPSICGERRPPPAAWSSLPRGPNGTAATSQRSSSWTPTRGPYEPGYQSGFPRSTSFSWDE